MFPVFVDTHVPGCSRARLPATGIATVMVNGRHDDLVAIVHEQHTIWEPAHQRLPELATEASECLWALHNRLERGVQRLSERQPETG
jgi:hypothetical protein